LLISTAALIKRQLEEFVRREKTWWLFSFTLVCSSAGRLKSVILALQFGFHLSDKHSCLDIKTTGGVCEEGGKRLGSDFSVTLAGRSAFLVCSLLLSGVQ
jgi:hypothetical protein